MVVTLTLSVSSPTLELQPLLDLLYANGIEGKLTPSRSIVKRDGIPGIENSVDIMLKAKTEELLEKHLAVAWDCIKRSDRYVSEGYLVKQGFEGSTNDYEFMT